MSGMSPETRAKLKTVSTATLMTALYKRGFRNQMIQGVRPLKAGGPTMVGEAYTLRYIPAREDLNPITVFRDRAHPQRKAVEECPPGAVMVIDSRKDARAASAGSILATRLMVRGCAGLVTDGGFRDADEIARLEMPSYHARPSAPTITSPGKTGASPQPIGTLMSIVGDGDGVAVIPAHLADAVADEAVEMTAYEDFVTEEVRKGRTILGLYPATDEQSLADFAAWRKRTGR